MGQSSSQSIDTLPLDHRWPLGRTAIIQGG
jgi:hypothetical protein